MYELPRRKFKSFIVLFIASILTLFFFFSTYSNPFHGLAYVNSNSPIFDAGIIGLSHYNNEPNTATIPSPLVTPHKHKTEQESSTPHATPVSSSIFTETVATPSPPTPFTGAIVAAVGTSTNLTWLSEIQNPMWTTHRYNHDAPTPETHFPVNKGNEAMMYLSYIINNYETLPDFSIFIHGHQFAWHQEGDMADMISNLRLHALEEEGYVSMRCDWYPSCPREIRPIDHDAVVWGPGVMRNETEDMISLVWPLFFPDEPLPSTIASQCCAQFAVTRAAIQNRSREDYERMRQWLIDTPLINDTSGRVFEKLWAYIFTEKAVNCPPPPVCACEYFGMCEQRQWFIPPPGLDKWDDAYD
jgi:hypothetical protein